MPQVMGEKKSAGVSQRISQQPICGDGWLGWIKIGFLGIAHGKVITATLSFALSIFLQTAPLSIIRRLTESCFPGPTYQYHSDLSPIVSVHRNFDSLGFAIDHPGRSNTDTYYVNKDTVLRTPPRTRPTRSARKLQAGSLFQPTCTVGMRSIAVTTRVSLTLKGQGCGRTGSARRGGGSLL